MDDDPDQPTKPDRVTSFAGRLLADLAPFGADQRDLEAGLEQLAPDATEEEVFEALDSGILAGLSWTEKRRALRQLQEQRVGDDVQVREPLLDVTRVENEDHELTGLHVLCSAPDARVFRDEDEILLVVGHDGEGRPATKSVDVPFDEFTIEHHEAEGVTEFVARPVPDETEGEGGEEAEEAEEDEDDG